MRRALLVVTCLCVAVMTARTVARPEVGELEAFLSLPAKPDARVTRVYDIQPLLKVLAHKPADLNAPSELFAVSSAQLQSEQEIAEDIVYLLVDTIDAASWELNGGAEGSVRHIGGMLIVRQTAQNQAAVAALLDKLHRIATRPPRKQSTLVE